MGDEVFYRDYGSGDERRVRVVFPEEADEAPGRVSVLTPTGATLLGLRRGEAIVWRSRAGIERGLTVLDIVPRSESS